MGTVYRRGKRWRAEVRKGSFYRSQTFLRKQNADNWVLRVELALEAGETPEAAFTVSEAIDRYAREVTPQKKGARWESVRLGRFKRYDVAAKRLKDVTAADMAAWRDRRLGEIKPASVARELNLWSSLFSIARREWGWIDANPVSEIRKPSDSPHRHRTITETEAQMIREALSRSDVGVLFDLALETGMRLGEMVGLRPDDVKGNYVVLRDTKNGTVREVPLSRKAQALVERIPVRVTSDSASTIFRTTVRKLGIEDVKFHDTRHTAATRLAQHFSVLELCRIFGWKDPRNAMIYFNPSAADLAAKLHNE